ncbi:MAG: chromate transporter [Oscillospiraceae bacterium]|nr:chromate transporter [Oscillospiraceae bacterium]
MIFWQLFSCFFKIGAFAFGCGYAMISIITDAVLAEGWLAEEEILRFIAVESVIPGPIAVNMATFVGHNQAGFLGSLVATFGVVLPSFIIVLLIAALFRNLLKYEGVKAFLNGMRPALVGLILATATTMGLKVIFGIKAEDLAPNVDLKSLLVFGLMLLIGFIWKKITKKEASLITMVLISGVIGLILFL